MTGTIKDYIGYGTIAARPVSPAVTALTGGSALYYATDTGIEYAWDGSAWHAVGTGLTNPMTQANSLITSTSGGTPVEATSAAGQFPMTDPTSGTAAFVAGGRKRIYHNLLGTTAASVTISSIPTGWNKLVIEITARSDGAITTNVHQMQFNGDTGANYNAELYEDAPTAFSGLTYMRIGSIPGASGIATLGTVCCIEIPGYAGTTFGKSAVWQYLRANSTGAYFSGHGAGWWNTTSAISSITLLAGGNNYIAGTLFNVYLEA